MIAKVINGELVYPTEAERKKIVIANPTDEILKTVMSYKEEIEGEIPTYDEETERLVKVVVSENDNEIHTAYDVVALGGDGVGNRTDEDSEPAD